MDILNNPNPLCRVLCPFESSCHKYWGQRLPLQAAQKPHYVLLLWQLNNSTICRNH